MSIISDRILHLKISGFDCRPASASELSEIMSKIEAAVLNCSVVKFEERFSFVSLSRYELAEKLKGFGIVDEFVMLCWPAYKECFHVKWVIFVANFDSFYYPSSDDMIVTTQQMLWFMEINHEEECRFVHFG